MRWIDIKERLPSPNDMVAVMAINREREEEKKSELKHREPRYLTGTYTYPEFLISIYYKNECFGDNPYPRHVWLPLGSLNSDIGDLAERYDIRKWCLLPELNVEIKEEIEKLNRFEILDL